MQLPVDGPLAVPDEQVLLFAHHPQYGALAVVHVAHVVYPAQ